MKRRLSIFLGRVSAILICICFLFSLSSDFINVLLFLKKHGYPDKSLSWRGSDVGDLWSDLMNNMQFMYVQLVYLLAEFIIFIFDISIH